MNWKKILWELYSTFILCFLVFLAIIGIIRTQEINSDRWQELKQFCTPEGYWGLSWHCNIDAYEEHQRLFGNFTISDINLSYNPTAFNPYS